MKVRIEYYPESEDKAPRVIEHNADKDVQWNQFGFVMVTEDDVCYLYPIAGVCLITQEIPKIAKLK